MYNYILADAHALTAPPLVSTITCASDHYAEEPRTHWAAYVAGVFLVLAREKGVIFAGSSPTPSSASLHQGEKKKPSRRDSVAILVSSDVPEGKGVSSSAAVEVATMCAVAAAYGVEFNGGVDDGGRELAVLCQMVENLVVGVPCGVMVGGGWFRVVD